MNIRVKRMIAKRIFFGTALSMILNVCFTTYAVMNDSSSIPQVSMDEVLTQFAGSGMVPVMSELFDNFNLTKVFEGMVQEAEKSGVEMPVGVYRCYEMMQSGQEMVPAADLEEAFPCLVYRMLYDMPVDQMMEMVRAPRPDAQSVFASDAIVGKNECDLTQVLGVLFKIKKLLVNCCEDLCRKFQETWTILEEIRDDIFDTKTVLCEKFEETWTILEEIRDDIFDTKTVLCDKFEETWTILEEIREDIFDTKTILCQKFDETWTILADIDEDIEECCNLLEEEIIFTRTLLCEKIEDGFNDTFTVLDELCNKFNETWTILADIDENIEECCNLLEEEIILTRTTILDILCEKFEQTWTILNEIEDAAQGFEECCDAFLLICEGTFTVLDEICNKIENIDVTATVEFGPVFTLLDELCEKIDEGFDGTFTVLSELCEKIEDINISITVAADLGGVFTTLEECCNDLAEDIFDTRTIIIDELCEKFDGTFTVLDELCEKINDLNLSVTVNLDLGGVFTALEECCNDLAEDIFDTRTIIIDELCDKFNQTWTILQGIEDAARGVEECCDAFLLICEATATAAAGTFTVLDELCEKINEGFDGTFTILDELCEKINDLNLSVTVNIDLGGVFTALEECCTDLAEDIFDTRTIIIDELCEKIDEGFDGTFTVLDELCEKINDLNLSVTVDFTGIFTSLDILCDKFEGTWTLIGDPCVEIPNPIEVSDEDCDDCEGDLPNFVISGEGMNASVVCEEAFDDINEFKGSVYEWLKMIYIMVRNINNELQGDPSLPCL